jgi:hypothetical protein
VVVAGAGVVSEVVVVVVLEVVLDVLLESPLSPPPQPTAKTIAAAPPNNANPVLACEFINASLSFRQRCGYPPRAKRNALTRR